MTTHNFISTALLCFAAMAFTACSDDDNNTTPEDGGAGNGSKFIITSTPIASDGVADYLLTVDDLTTGKVSTVGNGIEQDGTYRYYITSNNRFFSMLYGQGNPGAVTTYELNEAGKLTQVSDFQSETVHAFAAVDDDILMMRIPRSGDENASWYRINTESVEIVADGKINIVNLAGNGERAHFTWLTQVGNKVYAPYMSIKGCCNDTFGTQFPDSSWVAVYSYPEMELEKVIKDNRTSYIGRYFTNGLVKDEKGDVYAFSAALANNGGEFTDTNPSAILRINSGTTEFDQDYFFDIAAAADGHYFTAQNYAGNGKFILIMAKEKESFPAGKKLAIADVYNKTITWVNGIPAAETITKLTTNNLISDGKAFVGITTNETSYVYELDVNTATAKRGIEVEGGVITAISKLEVK